MHFINKLIKKGTFALILVFSFFTFLGAEKVSAEECQINLRDGDEYLVLNTKAGWSDSGVEIICDGTVKNQVTVEINGVIIESSSASGAISSNNYVKNAGFYKIKYFLTENDSISITRQVRVLPNDLNKSLSTWVANTETVNTTENDAFTKIIGVDDGYLAIGNFGNNAYIIKYDLIGRQIWNEKFDCLNTLWFFEGLGISSTSEISDVSLYDIIKTVGSTSKTDFYISGTYTKDGSTKSFVRRIQLSSGGNGGLVEYGKIIPVEMTRINKIELTGNYLVAVGYYTDTYNKTIGKIMRSTINIGNNTELVNISYYANSLESRYNSLIVVNDDSRAKIIAVGSSEVEGYNGAVGGYVTSCEVDNFTDENGCVSEKPYYYLTYNEASTTTTYFNDIVSRENGYLIVGKTRRDRIKTQFSNSENSSGTENVLYVLLNNNLGIFDALIKNNNSSDTLNSVKKINDDLYIAVGQKGATGYYSEVGFDDDGALNITERFLTGTSTINDIYIRESNDGEINYVFAGSTKTTKINDVLVSNKGNEDSFIAIVDKTVFANYDNISLLQNQKVCDGDNATSCPGNMVMDKYKMKYGNKSIAYPDSTTITSENVTDISTYHRFISFNDINFIIGRTIVVIENNLPDNIEIGGLGIDKWYLYNRTETTALRDGTWSEYYYPIEDNLEKAEGTSYYRFIYNTSTGKGEFVLDTRSLVYTRSNFLKYEAEPHNNKVAFQGEEKAKEYAVLQEYTRIALVNKKYNRNEGVNAFDDTALLTNQNFYFVYYIDLELNYENDSSCKLDANRRLKGICNNQKGYAFANLKSLQRILNQIIEDNNYFVSEQNTRYTEKLANKPVLDIYNDETTTELYTKELNLNLKTNVYLVVEFYETLNSDDGYYISNIPVLTSVSGKNNVQFKKSSSADYSKDGKYVVKYCYNYGEINEVCGESATFILDSTVPTISYKAAGSATTKQIFYEELYRGKSESDPDLLTRDITISNIFDIDPYAYTIVNKQKYYLKCNATVNDRKCINNLAEYVKIAYGYDKNEPDKIYSITASDRAGNEMTYYFKIGTQKLELRVEETDDKREDAFNLIIDLYERNDFDSLAVRYTQSEICTTDCTEIDETTNMASFGERLSQYIRAIMLLNKKELDKAREDPEYVINESAIIKSISFLISASTTLEDKTTGGISIPKVQCDNEECNILDDKDVFKISKGLYNFTLVDSFYNESRAIGGIGIVKAKLDIYVEDDESYDEKKSNFTCTNGEENCDKRLPTSDADELEQTSIFFQAKSPETYKYQDLIPTTLYNDFNKTMMFTNKFVYLKFKINNLGILRINMAKNLNIMNNFDSSNADDMECLFVLYGDQVRAPQCGDTEGINQYKFSDIKNAESDIINKLQEKGIYFITEMNGDYYLAFTGDGTYYVSSELYTDVTGVEGEEGNLITLPVEYTFVIDTKKPNIIAQVECGASENCKGENNNFSTADFIYDSTNQSYKIINIGSWGIAFDLESEMIMENVINRLLVMTFDNETYYNPYTCALGKCDESINGTNAIFTQDGRWLKFTKSGTYIITFVDAGGNRTSYAFTIDKEAPSIDEIVDVNNKNLSEYQQFADVRITVSENSFLENKNGETIMTVKYGITSSDSSEPETVMTLTVINENGNCKLSLGTGLVDDYECRVDGTTTKSILFKFVIPINESRKSGTNTLNITVTDYFNNTFTKRQGFIFDNEMPYIYYDSSYTPTTEFGKYDFDNNKQYMLSMAADASLESFKCENETTIADSGKILCSDLPSQENIKNNVSIVAYEANRVTYNNYVRDTSGNYSLRENNIYADANVTLFKKMYPIYRSEDKLIEDISNNAKIYQKGAYIKVSIDEQIDPNTQYYYGDNKEPVNIKEMYTKTYDEVCTAEDTECKLYTMYKNTGKFSDTNYYTKDNEGFTLVEDTANISTSNYLNYYYDDPKYVEDNGKYLPSTILPQTCVQVNGGTCEEVTENDIGKIKLISENIKYYNLVSNDYKDANNNCPIDGMVRVNGRCGILDDRKWQIAKSNEQEVKFGFGLVSTLGRPIIFRAIDGAGNYSVNYLETVIIIEDKIAPSVVNISSLEYVEDNRGLTETENNYIKTNAYYKVSNELRNNKCSENTYYKQVSENSYELVACDEINDYTQYYVKDSVYEKVADGLTKQTGVQYFVRYAYSLKTEDNKYKLTDKNLVVEFSEPIYKIECKYYSSITDQEEKCSINETEYDYRENKTYFELISDETEDTYINYTLTIYDFCDNQTTINYLFIDRQKPTIDFRDNGKKDVHNISVDYVDKENTNVTYDSEYINSNYTNDIKSNDDITNRINSQGADIYIKNSLTYQIIYYKYNFNITFNNYIKENNTFVAVPNGTTKDENTTYYTLMKKVSGYIFRGDYSCDSNSDYCYVEDYYNYYPSLLTDSNYWVEVAEDSYGNRIIKENLVDVYKIEYIVTDLAGNVSKTLIRTVYIEDTTIPEFKINGTRINSLSGYYNEVNILFENEDEGIFEVYSCTGTPDLCVLPTNIFENPRGSNIQKSVKKISESGGEYNYSNQAQGIYKFYVYDKGSYKENKICTNGSDCDNNSLNVMYLKYNYTSHQFIIDTTIPDMKIDAEIDEKTNKLYYAVSLKEDAKLYCKKGELRGEISTSDDGYYECEEMLNGTFRKESYSGGYNYIKTNSNGEVVYKIVYTKVLPNEDKYFYVTYYFENSSGGFSEYEMGHNFTTEDASNVYKISSIVAYIREDGGYLIKAVDKAMNSAGRSKNNNDHEDVSRIDVDNTAPDYNKSQNTPTGSSYWFSVPVDVISNSNVNVISTILSSVSNSNNAVNINDLSILNSNLFYAFATKTEAIVYLYNVYSKHIDENARVCNTNKYCYSYYDLSSRTFIEGRFDTKEAILQDVASYLSKLIFPTYGGDKLFGDSSIYQGICDPENNENCKETNMYKYVYLKKNDVDNSVSIEETCDSTENCIKVYVKILNYIVNLNIDLEVNEDNTRDTESIRYYYKTMTENGTTNFSTPQTATFNLQLNGNTYYIFEEVDRAISYTNSSNNKIVNHSNKSYYAVFVDDNSFLNIKYRSEKNGETVDNNEEIYINSSGISNTIKTNTTKFYLILKKSSDISRFEQKYEIYKNEDEVYSYLRLIRTIQREFDSNIVTYENINDYLKIGNNGEYYFEIPVGIADDDNMITTLEFIDRAGNVTKVIVSKSQISPNIQLSYVGEGSNQYALVTIVDTWNTRTLTNNLDAKWSSDGEVYETSEDILKSLKCLNGTTGLLYGCENTDGSANGKNIYKVKISNINHIYGFFEISLQDDHGNTNQVKFIYNPIDFTLSYSTDSSNTIKYIDNNTFIEEEQRMITKGDLILKWDDITNYINLYKLNNNSWQLVCTSQLMGTTHSGKCSTTGNQENKIEAEFISGNYSQSTLTYKDEGIYKVELVNRESILIQKRCIGNDGTINCKDIYTDVSIISSWEVNELNCLEALQIKKKEMENSNTGRRYSLFEIDKTNPDTSGVTITVNKPSGKLTFNTIQEFINDFRNYINSEVTIEWQEKLVSLKWSCNYNLTYVIKEINGRLSVVWVDNGSTSSVLIESNSFTIGQTYYTITKNQSNQDVISWNKDGVTKFAPITINDEGNKTFKLLNPCKGDQTAFNEAGIKTFTINSKNDVIYTFLFEDFAGNITESSEFTFSINIKLPEIEIYEVDENGNKLIGTDGNELIIMNGEKVKNNVKLFCYEDSVVSDCTDIYSIELYLETASGYTRRDTNIMVKEVYGRTSKYKYVAYVKKDTNGNYYPSLYSEIEFIIDKQPPKITISGNKVGVFEYYKGEVGVSIDDTVNGEGIIYGGCVLENDEYTCNDEPIATFSASGYVLLKTGTYKIIARDEIGNITVGRDIQYITIDNDSPDISVTADTSYVTYELSENSYTNAKMVSVTSVDNNLGSYLKYRINDGEWITIESTSMQFTEEGVYEIKAFDTVGNESIERHFVIYRQAPKYQLFINDNDASASAGDFIKGYAYITWKEPTSKAEAPIVKVTLNGEAYSKKQKVQESGEYMFVLTDLAGNTTTYKISINNSDNICLNNVLLKPKKQYLLELQDGKSLIIKSDKDYKFSANDTLVFATPTSQYKGTSSCGNGVLGYRSLDEGAYMVLNTNDSNYLNEHSESVITVESKYQNIISNLGGFVYVFVVDKKVAKKELGMNIGENFFNKDPLGWSLIFIAGAAIIYGFGKVVIFRKKVKVLK